MLTFAKQLALSAAVLSAAGTVSAQSATHSDNRIVGGVNIDISIAPATVALLSNRILNATGSYLDARICGGTVIAPRWVLTAAHCLVQEGVVTAPSALSVMMGSTDLNAPVNAPVSIRQVIPHSEYSAATSANDIALLELEYDALVTPATLDTQEIALNDDALIAGWGALNMYVEGQEQQFTPILQGALVKMIPGEQCESMFELYAGAVDTSQLCAGNPEGGVDSCQGDSGGPLYRFNADNPSATQVAGITSWGYGCALAEAPGVYTRVAAFSDWIAANSRVTSGEIGGDIGGEIGGELDDDIEGDVDDEMENDDTTTLTFLSGGGASGFALVMVLGAILLGRRSNSRIKATATQTL